MENTLEVNEHTFTCLNELNNNPEKSVEEFLLTTQAEDLIKSLKYETPMLTNCSGKVFACKEIVEEFMVYLSG